MSNELQVEDDKNDPDRLADKGLVTIVTVPVTLAVVGPDAVFETSRVAGPATPLEKEIVDVTPPETSSSSVSVSSIGVLTSILQRHCVAKYKDSTQPHKKKLYDS